MPSLVRNNNERVSTFESYNEFGNDKTKTLVAFFASKETDNTVHLPGNESQLASRHLLYMTPLYLMPMQCLERLLICQCGLSTRWNAAYACCTNLLDI